MWTWFIDDGDPRDWPKNIRTEADDYVAEQLAEFYHDHHGGWEYRWPLNLTIVSPNEKQTTFCVDRESVPQFYAKLKA